MDAALLVDMHHLRRREAVEIRAAGGGVGADVLAVDVVTQVHVRQLLGEADGVERVARRAALVACHQAATYGAIASVLVLLLGYGSADMLTAIEAEKRGAKQRDKE